MVLPTTFSHLNQSVASESVNYLVSTYEFVDDNLNEILLKNPSRKSHICKVSRQCEFVNGLLNDSFDQKSTRRFDK